jgi:hypothetical protein
MMKVMELIRLLVAEPDVRGRIHADPVLREMWSEPGVRRRITEGASHRGSSGAPVLSQHWSCCSWHCCHSRQTLWGWGWILQASGALLASVGFLVARRGSGAGWGIAGVAALLLAISPALSGHAATMTGVLGTLAVAADAVHVLAAGGGWAPF